MGHEFTGVVVETGSEVKAVKPGDKIVSPFTVSWYADQNSWGGGHLKTKGMRI
jgi:threonine dehydrogenase-like Zn-dependent dehydrogenase